MKYEEPQPVDRADAIRIFSTGAPDEICAALIGVTFHDADWRWVQGRCLTFLSHESLPVRALAVTCLGHIARIHRQLDRDLVVPALERLTADPKIGGTAEDALEDIRIFLDQPQESKGEPTMTDMREPLFEVDEVFHLEGREGHILVGRVVGGATLKAGDRVGFETGDGAFVALTVEGLDITPRAAEGQYSLLVTGRGAERAASGTLLTAGHERLDRLG